MKKTIITLFALAGVASATTTDFLDLSQTSTNGHLTFDAETSTITTDGSTSGRDHYLWEINNAGLQTILALKINLTEAKKVTTDTAIVSLDFANGDNDLPDIGLMATSTGLSASLGGSTAGRDSTSWSSLSALKNCLTEGSDGNQYIVLSFAHIPTSPLGVALYSNTGTLFQDAAARHTSQQDTLNGIYVNPDLVAAIEVRSDWATPNTLVEPFKTTAANSLTVPEPTTATLSLLALAGLAVRRRRN